MTGKGFCASIVAALALATIAIGCADETPETRIVRDTITDTVVKIVEARDTVADGDTIPVTLPVLDAFFADSTFAGELERELALTDTQIEQLRAAAREETAKLRESTGEEYSGTTTGAYQLAATRINAIIGDEKRRQLYRFVRQRWSGGMAGDSTMAGRDSLGMRPNQVPTDTRIVVNAPAYRMDVFENGTLVKSYKVAIGYPEFPLPAGMRSAKTIIFNPTWTPPDEPWVESSKTVKPGEKVGAGSPHNPLGIAKIPIGLPSLIHGGKSQGQLGRFGSHGCVGLTDALMQDFSLLLAEMTGTTLTTADINNYKKNRKETKNVDLARAIPVELRYETMVVENGKLYIYRDVYDQNTNTEAGLRAVLAAHGASLDALDSTERRKVMDGLAQMSLDASGRADTAKTDTTGKKPGDRNITRTMKGKREVVVEIASLKGKGYPAPVKLNTPGSARSSAKGTTVQAPRPSGNKQG